MLKLDLSYIQTIAADDQEFMNNLLGLYLTSTFPELSNIKNYTAQKQWELLASAAHKIKAPIQMLGVPEVTAIIDEMEKDAKAKQNEARIHQLVIELEKYFKEMERQIKKIMESKK